MSSYILAIFLFVAAGSSEVIVLPNNRSNLTLEDYLCNGISISNDSNITLILQSNITHVVPSPNTTNSSIGSICLSTYTNSIVTIRSDSEKIMATVRCTGTNLATRRGFAFSNMSFLTISNVRFEGCGGILTNPLVSFVNETSPYFYSGSCQPAALLFHNCSNLTLLNIEIANFLGFGLMLLDSYYNITVVNISIHDHIYRDEIIKTNIPSYCILSIASGAGILIYYNKSQTATINITNCYIAECYNENYGGKLIQTLHLLTDQTTSADWPSPIVGGSGITMILLDDIILPNIIPFTVTLKNFYLVNNTGIEASAIAILSMGSQIPSVYIHNLITENNCVFDSNSKHFNMIGRSITAYYNDLYSNVTTKPLTITSSSFCGSAHCGEPEEQGSTTEVVIIQKTKNILGSNTIIKDSTFNGITGSPRHGLGIALYANRLGNDNGKLSIVLDNVTAYDFECYVKYSMFSCYKVGVFGFSNVNVSIIGGQFYNISTTSVITASFSNIFLSQDPVFINTVTESFGAINLRLSSILYLVEPLHAKFANNKALLGAAIYAVDDESEYCVLQFLPQKYYDESNYTNLSIEVHMDSNVADLAGNSMYISPIQQCIVLTSETLLSPSISKNLSLLINNTFTFKRISNIWWTGNYEYTTTPSAICSCIPGNNSLECVNSSISKTVHPGDTITIWVAAFDVDRQFSVYSLITAQFPSCILPGGYIGLSSDQVITRIQQGVCTKLSYTIFHTTNRTYPIENIRLDIAPYTHTPRFHVNLTLTSCPDGFEAQSDGTCKCVYENGKFHNLTCNIEDGTVNHPPSSWLGLTEDGKYAYSIECPPLYCYAGLDRIDLSKPDTLCYDDRTGTLCGTCSNNLSAVFGTADCMDCSNAYLVTILVYAIAGVLLVVLLFVLNLTLTSGTINGLVFYANLISNNHGYLYGHKSTLLYLRVCISLINLELGFPMCFYNGMNELVLRSLQFVFPIYIWTIMIVIIYASRHSVRLSKITGKRSVSVLATLTYLSYSKICITIVNTFTPATIHTDDGQSYVVWYLDGSLKYGTWPHIVPIIISIMMVALFVIPFNLLTTLAPFLRRINLINRYMPLADAVFAPYKDKWRFWFGLRIWLLTAALIITAALRGYNVKLSLAIQFLLIMGFSLVQAFIQPFKNSTVEIIDLFYMVNFSLVAFTVVYIEKESSTLHYFAGALVNLALIVFVGIVIYHTYKAIKPFIKCHRKSSSLLDTGFGSVNNYGSTKQLSQVNSTPTHSEIPDITHDMSNYREPLLDHIEN